MSDELVTVTIDGVPVTVPKGTPLIEAAKRAGILIPHYCYHPSLPAPAVCRMCLVEVDKAPKLLPACVTTVADGQVVHVHSEEAEKAREGVLEFLLINHPLDCPICDQAGECELQDYVFQEGRAGSRYDDYPKRFNPVENFGPDILYVPNRCILCTRCVRFMDDVANTPVLNVSERGDRATIGIFPDQQLDHPWSGNVVDLCPVGSLISKDFLHKARAWDLDKTASICPGCTQGCNVSIETRDNTVVRLRPRPNMEVNRHFMCDEGRMNYRWMNRGDRVEAPRLREGDRHQAVDWDTALTRLARLLLGASGSAVLLASGRGSTESLGHLRRMLDRFDLTAAIKVPLGEEAPLDGVPELALRAERVPNLAGATLLGYTAAWETAVEAARDAALVVLVDELLTPAERDTVRHAGAVVVLSTLEREGLDQADVVLPITTMAEEYGTYINRDHRLQRFLQAKSAPGMARPAWWIAVEALAIAEDHSEAPGSADEALAALGEHVPSLAGLRYRDIGFVGRTVTRDIPAGAGR
jgi:NADH-quinone oxidoreductase subunit G